MMSALRTRRQPKSRASDRRALRAPSSEYDDDRRRVEEPPKEMLPGQDLVSEWADIDDTDGSDMERAVELASDDVVDENVFVPVIPKRANEFTCSSCFLVHHMSRLASSKGGRLICADCA
jgi:hypothetical protein